MYAPFPANEWRYCQYAQFLAEEEKVLGTVQNYVGTVKVLHKLQGYTTPSPGQIHYKMLSNGIKSGCLKPVKQAEPLTHDVLLLIFTQVNFADEVQVVTWVAVLVGFSLVLRVSNLGPASRAKFHSAQHFLRSDLIYKKGFWTMNVRWTKTVQYRNKIMATLLVPARFKEICPQHWVKRMTTLIPAAPHEPFFLVREGNNRFPLTSAQVNKWLKQWTKDAGLDSSRYTDEVV